MKKSSRAVIYARVSSTGDRQDTERQVADCLAFLRKGNADTLLLSELSRLGRSVRKILDVVRRLRKGLSVRDTAAACGVSAFTVLKVKKAM